MTSVATPPIERCHNEDMYLAIEFPDSENRYDELRVPQILPNGALSSISSQLESQYPVRQEMETIHRMMYRRSAGDTISDSTQDSLRLATRSISSDGDFKHTDLASRITKVETEYAHVLWEKRVRRAAAMGMVASRYSIYVVTSDPANRDDIYSAEVSGFIATKDGLKSGIEPVIKSARGDRLLPIGFFMFRGLYTPRAVLPVEALARLS